MDSGRIGTCTERVLDTGDSPHCDQWIVTKFTTVTITASVRAIWRDNGEVMASIQLTWD